MAVDTVVLDANVLYPAPLRDFLLRLAVGGLFRARWTDRIHDEWIRNVLRNRPDLSARQLERTRALMNDTVPDCLVRGYEPLMDRLTLPDPNDRHVLAAAIKCDANLIVTFNLNDFPAAAVRPHGLDARHPDDFIHGLLEDDAESVCKAAGRQRNALRNPPKSAQAFLATLQAQGLPRTAARLDTMIESI